MIAVSPNRTFFQTVLSIPTHAPRGSLLPSFIAGIVVAGFDFGSWLRGGSGGVYGVLSVILGTSAWVFVGYWMVTSCTDTKISPKGFLFFAAAALAIIFPALIGLGFANLFKQTNWTVFSGSTLVVLLLLSVFFAVFLPAWPLSQAKALRFVSPITVWTETKGCRWGLVVATFAVGSIAKNLPAIDVAHSNGGAILLFMGHLFLNGVVNVAYGSIAVAAWLFGQRNGEKLGERMPGV